MTSSNVFLDRPRGRSSLSEEAEPHSRDSIDECGVGELCSQAKEELMTSLGLQEEEGSALQALRRGYKVSAAERLGATSCCSMCFL